MNAIDGKYSIGPNNAQKHERLWYNCILGSIQFLDYTRFSCHWFSTGNDYENTIFFIFDRYNFKAIPHNKLSPGRKIIHILHQML